jgi:GTP-binding protein
VNDAAAPRDFVEEGRKLFAGPCDFIWAAAKIDGLPPMGPPEIAFAGRSNVGKSSLINALTGRKTLARTSQTPGRTQQLNFFVLGDERMRLVDMPGYGYAAVGRKKVGEWTELAHGYLRGRASLMRVFLLVDGRHGLKDVDHETMKQFDQSAVSYQVVLTKLDAVKKADQELRISETVQGLLKHPAAFPNVLFTSSDTSEGVPELRGAIMRLLAERGS